MTRPEHNETADARTDAQRFIAANPNHELAPALRVLLRRTAPPTQAEAIPVMVQHANEAGWASDIDDEQRAVDALAATKPTSTWEGAIWAQWKTLTHFMGGGT